MTDFLSLKMCNKGRANIFAVDRDVIRRVSYPDSCMSQIIFVSSLRFLSLSSVIIRSKCTFKFVDCIERSNSIHDSKLLLKCGSAMYGIERVSCSKAAMSTENLRWWKDPQP